MPPANAGPDLRPRTEQGHAGIPWEAIIFDFDFTLADSSSGIVECVGCALQQLGFQIPPAEQILDTIGLSLADTFRCLTGKTDTDMSMHFVHYFHEYADQIMDKQTSVYRCVQPVMQSLRRANIRSGIVSTKLNYRVLNILKNNNLDHLFDVIVGADDVAKAKPDPEGLLLALGSLGVISNAAIYVGDHIIDAEAAHMAGMEFVAVLSGRHLREHFEDIPHLAILGSIEELPVFLGLSEKECS
jgi:phosphoglycolate phosphatase